MNQFVYDITQNNSNYGVKDALQHVYKTKYPVIICVGSDLAIGDSLGPIIGSELNYKLFENVFQ